MQSIKQNNFITWPELIPELIRKHLPKSIATIRGHQETERQGLKSTSSTIVPPETEEEIMQDYFPLSDQPNIKTNAACYVLIHPNNDSTACIDLTIRFPKRSSRGNECILAGYHHDANCILGHPMKNRKGDTIT